MASSIDAIELALSKTPNMEKPLHSPTAFADWLHKPRTPLVKSRDLDQALNWAHPRAQFVKTLPRDAHLLDFGAGDGGLVVFRSWPAPKREDLTFYGYSLEPIARARDYQAVEIARFEDRTPQFGGRRFDAVFCSHVIEHLNDPEAFLDWAQQALAARGRLYLEWPSTATLTLPRREDLLAYGVGVMVSNFFDDATHQALPERPAVASGLEGRGFSIEQAGLIRLPFYEEELLAHDQRRSNPGYRLQAFWSHTGWRQYLVAQKR